MKPTMKPTSRHTILESLLMHLAPGIITALVYGLLASFLRPLGLPSLLALIIAALLVLVPLELGFLLWQGRQMTGKFTLRGVIAYQQKTPWWQSVLLIIACVLWAGVVMTLLKGLDQKIMQYFTWLPQSYFLVEDFSVYPKTVQIITALLSLLVVALIAPTVEELYFRGYLLPRIAWLGALAPVIGALFFSLYHFWSPWQVVSRTLAVLPMIAVVFWKKDLRLAIWTHCLLNSVDGITMLIAALR
jgi:uncharacterized protein